VRSLVLLAITAIALAASAAYTVRWNPEVRFFCHALEVKNQWLVELRRTNAPVILVAGGSSCAFSIDAARLDQQYHLPVVNYGLHAGMEPPFLAAAAAAALHPGDTWILAIEPGLLTAPFTAPDLAAQMGFALRKPEWTHGTPLTGDPVRWVEDALSLRPGAYHLFTLLGKMALHRPLYRYAFNDVRPGGWMQTPERFPMSSPPLGEARLSSDARRLLEAARRWADTNHVAIAYSLPWGFVDPGQADAFRRCNARFLLEVAAILPVLEDPALGVHPVRDHYADTEWHLTEPGARERTDSFARQLQTRRFWSSADLKRLGAEP
jgi:hypothetical protein